MKRAVTSVPVEPPPSSPPTTHLLINKTVIHAIAQITKTTTEKPSAPAGTKYFPFPLGLLYSQMRATTQGSPRPRNTFTLFDPVTFPIAASA